MQARISPVKRIRPSPVSRGQDHRTPVTTTAELRREFGDVVEARSLPTRARDRLPSGGRFTRPYRLGAAIFRGVRGANQTVTPTVFTYGFARYSWGNGHDVFTLASYGGRRSLVQSSIPHTRTGEDFDEACIA